MMKYVLYVCSFFILLYHDNNALCPPPCRRHAFRAVFPM